MPSYNRVVIHNDLKCVSFIGKIRAAHREPAAYAAIIFSHPLLVSSVGRRGGHYLNFVPADSSFQRQSLLAPFSMEIYLPRNERKRKRTRTRRRDSSRHPWKSIRWFVSRSCSSSNRRTRATQTVCAPSFHKGVRVVSALIPVDNVTGFHVRCSQHVIFSHLVPSQGEPFLVDDRYRWIRLLPSAETLNQTRSLHRYRSTNPVNGVLPVSISVRSSAAYTTG